MEARFKILPDRMPPIPTEKMTDAQKKVAADIIAGGSSRGKIPRCLSSLRVKSYRVMMETPAAVPSHRAASRRSRCYPTRGARARLAVGGAACPASSHARS